MFFPQFICLYLFIKAVYIASPKRFSCKVSMVQKLNWNVVNRDAEQILLQINPEVTFAC